jgi:hypothetical protein
MPKLLLKIRNTFNLMLLGKIAAFGT